MRCARPIPLCPSGARLILSLTLLGVSCAPAGKPDGELPEVVLLVVLDTLAAGHVSHLGYDRLTTPALDGLARDGVSFERAFSPASYTVASIPSLMTGRLPDRHGVISNSYRLHEDEQTLAELMRAAGYATFGAIAVANGGPPYGVDQGFDDFVEVYSGPGAPGAQVTELQGRVVHVPTPEEFAPLVRARLDRRRPGERLFVYLHVLQPHGPYDPPLAYKQHFRDERYPGPYRDGDRVRIQERIRAGGLDRATKEAVVQLYDANVLWADENLGRVLDALRERGLYERALIVVTADHGEAFWQHGQVGHGTQIYEESVRVPLVVKLAAGESARGLHVEELSSTMDVLPSLCSWLDLEAPIGPLDGQVLKVGNEPAAAAGPQQPRALLLRSDESTGRIGLRTADNKLIGQLEAGRISALELYDLSRDPRERHDLAPDQPERAEELSRTVLAKLNALDPATAPPSHLLPLADRRLLEQLGYTGLDDE